MNTNTIEWKQLSSLEKVFMHSAPEADEFTALSVLRNESFSYQIAYFKKSPMKCPLRITIESKLKKHITIRRALHVPVQLPLRADNCDDDYLMREPGLAPDVLVPIELENTQLIGERWESFWITVDLNGYESAGNYDITIIFEFTENNSKQSIAKTLAVDVIDALLPSQSLKYTQWFHCDCIASYFKVPIFSEEHWKLIKAFLKTAVKNGVNMILTPLFTPPLDTEVGGERPTVQLVKVIKQNAQYSFHFTLLDRWIDLCLQCGIKYFEMTHLFTQWGAKYAPKIMAEVNGVETRIFGWDTESTSTEYKAFLAAFLPALNRYLQKKGIAEYTYFHISDEPHGEETKETYLLAKNIIKKHLKGYKIIDALSDITYYKEGVVEIPIPASDAIRPFLNEDLPERWTYYCVAQGKNVSNRFIAVPSYRNRVIADQIFKYNIDGFLHWGYNFYYSQLSRYPIDPYVITDADGAFQSGDSFSVYPFHNGTADSIRSVVFENALSDLRAMQLLESMTGHEHVVALIEQIAGMNIEFDQYPKSAEYILRRREAVNNSIKELLSSHY